MLRVMRSGLGSCGVVLPKKLSSSMAARPVCASLLPIRPNLYGFVPSCCSSFRPFFSAERAYSNSSISFFLATLPSRLPLSQHLEIGELVVGRQERMRLAVALGLRGLVQPLPLRALLRVFAIELLAERFDDRETSGRC